MAAATLGACGGPGDAAPASASQIYQRYVRDIQQGIAIGRSSDVRAGGYDKATGELTGITLTHNGMPASADRMQVLIDADADTVRFVLYGVVIADPDEGLVPIAKLETEPLSLGVDVQPH